MFLRGRSAAPLARVAQALGDVQRAVAKAGGVPLHVAADQEGGEVQTLSGPGMPHIPSAVQQGALDSAQLARQTQVWAAALVQSGVTLDLAAVADVVPTGTAATNPPIGAVDRQFGATPDAVSADVRTVVTAAASVQLLSTVKHFPGLGRVTANTDTSALAVDPATSATDPALAPFEDAVAAGVAAVMMSSASYPALDPHNLAVFSPTIITGLLRTRLRFSGLIMSDDLGNARAVSSMPPGQRAVRFVAAGGDMVLTVQETDVAR